MCPIDPGTDQTQYKLLFDVKDQVTATCIDGGLAGKEKKTYALRDGALAVTADLFDNDALVIEGDQAHSVALARPDGTPYLTVEFAAPLFGIWSPPKKKAPFICIEPWYGRCDSVDFTGDFKEREWGQKLSGTAFEASYRITVS
jgi:galactose mutarotase-like enzyme